MKIFNLPSPTEIYFEVISPPLIAGSDLSPEQKNFSLSAGQIGIWFAQQLDPKNPAFLLGEQIDIYGEINPGLFSKSLKSVIQECESLFLTFFDSPEGPKQYVQNSVCYTLDYYDLSNSEQPLDISKFIIDSALSEPIDISHEPPFKFKLLKFNSSHYRWTGIFHHIAIDGYSLALFSNRLGDIYSSLSNNSEHLIESNGSLSKIFNATNEYNLSNDYNKDKIFWDEFLEQGIPPTFLNNKSDRLPKGSLGKRLRKSILLSPSSCKKLLELSNKCNSPLSNVLITLLTAFIHRLSGFQDGLFSLPISARTDANRRTPFMLSNIVPFELKIYPNDCFIDLILATSRIIKNFYPHRFYRWEEMNRHQSQIGKSNTFFGPVINVLSNHNKLLFNNFTATRTNLSLGPVDDVSLTAYTDKDATFISIDIDLNSLLHTEEYQDTLTVALEDFLESAVANPDQSISKLSILSPDERHTILQKWNDTEQLLAPKTL
ncbi:condensation domain-containing protein, partial [Polynucleobacter sp. MG-28-Ekke-A2]|uniref:condensation domain-containing protein n=1 Tax=Polynucleobacter sp. MG-28-Ekke-A2 TaxID=3108276 RepID=UPI002B22D776